MISDDLAHFESRIHVDVWKRSTERLDGEHITDDALQERHAISPTLDRTHSSPGLPGHNRTAEKEKKDRQPL